jgi:aspartate kinase
VVVSAMGKTTDKLVHFSSEAARGHLYPASKDLDDMLEHHLEQAALVTSGDALTRVETSLQRHFRDLRMILFELTGEGRELTPALQDEILSVGERVSSEIVAAALDAAGVPSAHLDARQLILTDDRHTQATPRYWETYAKLRRVLPRLAEERVVVLGGFIGATAEGVTTTLGRGGSDLTASIVGAGVNAEEIQIWTDVDGMLSCDPRSAILRARVSRSFPFLPGGHHAGAIRRQGSASRFGRARRPAADSDRNPQLPPAGVRGHANHPNCE